MATQTIEYSLDITTELCSRMAEGTSLRKVCESDDMPSKSLVFKWLSLYPEFRDQYARAREALLASHEQDIIELADDIPANATAIDVAKAKLQIDSRKWIMSKLSPKQYGDKVQNELTNPDGSLTPQAITVKVVTKKE